MSKFIIEQVGDYWIVCEARGQFELTSRFDTLAEAQDFVAENE